jgi:hypothetical protein
MFIIFILISSSFQATLLFWFHLRCFRLFGISSYTEITFHLHDITISSYLMAFVLSPPSPQFELAFGSSICSRSASSLSELGTVRHFALRTSSTSSFKTCITIPVRPIFGKKENSPLKGSHSSLNSFSLYEGVPVTISPRRSWSWNVAGDHSELRQPTPDSDPDYDFLAAPDFECDLTHIKRSIGLENFEELDSEVESCVSQDSTALEPSSIVLEKPLDGVEYIDHIAHIDFQSQAYSTSKKWGPTSPFKRWLRTLRWKTIPQELATKIVANESEADDSLDVSILTPPISMSQLHGHRKNLSSTSSAMFLSAVKTASVTIASVSLYPRSRRSGFVRSEDSLQDFHISRKSCDSYLLTSIMDDGTWIRSVQRHRIVDEIISSEESYIRDLKTLLNVTLHKRLCNSTKDL